MFKSIKVRAALAGIVSLVALVYLLPSLALPLPDFWKKYLPTEKIHLGLDLQGGMHLVLEVDTQKALETTVERTAHDLKEILMENKVRFRNIERKGDILTLELKDNPSRVLLEKILKEQYTDLSLSSSEVRDGMEMVSLTINDRRRAELKKHAVDQSLETIRNRVDQFGISEPEIIPEGQDRIIVQLPGIKDAERAKNLIGKTALLEFKLVNDENSLAEALAGKIPEGSVLAQGYNVDRETGRRTQVDYLLKDKVLLTGDSLDNARMEISDRFGFPHIS
ncbi:MAG: protein translocase subunit SecD, partial [Smithellaceae bacterium]|nr:protein translocase subunit SecD [Smithellaceae bacterium]